MRGIFVDGTGQIVWVRKYQSFNVIEGRKWKVYVTTKELKGLLASWTFLGRI